MHISPENIILAMATLAGCIGVLWKILDSINKARVKELEAFRDLEKQRLEKCEKMHEEASKEMLEMAKELSELKGRQEAVEKLSKSVLEKLTERRRDYVDV